MGLDEPFIGSPISPISSQTVQIFSVLKAPSPPRPAKRNITYFPVRTRIAQTAPYDSYTCHLCGSVLQYHPEYQTEHPWFEHWHETLTENGQRHCPYVNSAEEEVRRINKLRRYVADAQSVILKTDWHCSGCGNNYHCERYRLTCGTDDFGRMLEEITLRAYSLSLYP
jgi:transposase-like protein